MTTSGFQYVPAPVPVVTLGQVWFAADGSHRGYIVVGWEPNGDVRVVGFQSGHGLDAHDTTIDPFKLSYRYYLAAECKGW